MYTLLCDWMTTGHSCCDFPALSLKLRCYNRLQSTVYITHGCTHAHTQAFGQQRQQHPMGAGGGGTATAHDFGHPPDAHSPHGAQFPVHHAGRTVDRSGLKRPACLCGCLLACDALFCLSWFRLLFVQANAMRFVFSS